MVCSECKTPLKDYAKFCLNCRSAVVIEPQPLYFKRQKVFGISLILILVSLPTLGIPYLLYWTHWIHKSKQAYEAIKNERHISSFYVNIAWLSTLLGLNLLALIIFSIATGRVSDDGGLLTVYSILSFAALGLSLSVWALTYFVYNFKIYKKLQFFLESNHGEIKRQRISIVTSLFFGHMYFQSRVNYWQRFVKAKAIKPQNKEFKITKHHVSGIVIGIVLLLIAVPSITKSEFWYAYASPINENTAALATHTNMTTLGRSILYRTKPVATDKATVDKDCENTKTDVIEYGCFFATSETDAHIYILQVTDPELKSVNDVTAAHEMLHHAYARLSSADRAKVNSFLIKDRDSLIASNLQFQKLIAPYADEAEEVKLNEAHSLMAVMPKGTLSPELENYYLQYFSDGRLKLITAEDTFNAAIARHQQSLDSIIATLDSQLKNIDEFEAVLNNQDIALANYSRRGNTYAYNALVPTYNSNLEKYKSNINIYNGNVDLYNNEVESFNNKLQGVQPNGLNVQAQTKKSSEL